MTVNSPPKTHKPRVFVSYVREDQDVVARLAKELSAYGIKVWLDKTELKPGHRWKDAIREAISEGDFFIACFSEAYQRRSRSYMNEELTLAIEELRQRPTDRAWFIPVLLSECKIPAMNIGAGQTLLDIQWVELHRNWEEGITKIAVAIDSDAQIFQPPHVWQLDDREWHILTEELRIGRFLLILGRGINYGVISAEEVLTRKWARELEKPEYMGLPFSQVAEHMAETYSRAYVIDTLVEEYTRARFSEFNASGEPQAVLSQLPCDVFITTCIDSFMEDALTRWGKKPRSAIVGLSPEMKFSSRTEEYKPTVSEPLVVHFFGHFDAPESLVVTVDDQMEFMRINIHHIPVIARSRTVDSPSMWLGFDSGSIEQKIMYSFVDNLAGRARRRLYHHFFDKEFEMRSRQLGRQRILLREFMAELELRWKMDHDNHPYEEG